MYFKSQNCNYKSKCTYYKRTELQGVDIGCFQQNNWLYFRKIYIKSYITVVEIHLLLFNICQGYFLFISIEQSYIRIFELRRDSCVVSRTDITQSLIKMLLLSLSYLVRTRLVLGYLWGKRRITVFGYI